MKTELQKAFESGVEYQKQFNSTLSESYDKPNFEQWYKSEKEGIKSSLQSKLTPFKELIECVAPIQMNPKKATEIAKLIIKCMESIKNLEETK